MFAALTVARFREAALAAGLCETKSWLSPDEIGPLDLPLAFAAQKVCGSMQMVLGRTKRDMERELENTWGKEGELSEERMHLLKTKASEVRIVKYQEDLRKVTLMYMAEKI